MSEWFDLKSVPLPPHQSLRIAVAVPGVYCKVALADRGKVIFLDKEKDPAPTHWANLGSPDDWEELCFEALDHRGQLCAAKDSQSNLPRAMRLLWRTAVLGSWRGAIPGLR